MPSGLVIYFAASHEAPPPLQAQLDVVRAQFGGLGSPLATLVPVADSSEAENLAGLPLPRARVSSIPATARREPGRPLRPPRR